MSILKSREAILALAILILLGVIASRFPGFVTPANLARVFTDTSPLILLALGQMAVILTKCIDLSVAANLALCGMIAAMLNGLGVPLPAILLAVTLLVGGYIYAGLVFDADPLGLIHIEPNELNIFVAVAFASSPGVFRIVRGLTLDIKTREYINAALTRGETPWYIMLWEILPNARGPLIVDFCLRIGYTTILLGTLGFFGLGMSSESPDWGTAIKDGSQFLRLYAWPALVPAVALMSFVLGLNLLADSLREQSLRD